MSLTVRRGQSLQPLVCFRKLCLQLGSTAAAAAAPVLRQLRPVITLRSLGSFDLVHQCLFFISQRSFYFRKSELRLALLEEPPHWTFSCVP